MTYRTTQRMVQMVVNNLRVLAEDNEELGTSTHLSRLADAIECGTATEMEWYEAIEQIEL